MVSSITFPKFQSRFTVAGVRIMPFPLPFREQATEFDENHFTLTMII